MTALMNEKMRQILDKDNAMMESLNLDFLHGRFRFYLHLVGKTLPKMHPQRGLIFKRPIKLAKV